MLFDVGQLGLIHYPVICLCLFRNYLSVSKLNCLMIFFLPFLISDYFFSTWMVSDPFCDFSFYSLKLCCDSLSYSIGMSRSSPLPVASPFFPKFDKGKMLGSDEGIKLVLFYGEILVTMLVNTTMRCQD